MNLSHYCGNSTNIKVVIDLCNDISKEELLIHLNGMKASSPDTETELILNGLLNNKLGFVIMNRLNIKPHTLLSELNNNKINALVDEIKAFEVICTGTKGFDSAQVTRGGINTDEINEHTMMSKINDGLFMCGEILNLHGDCGGYNLHLAWTTGRIAGNSVAEYLGRL
jgi:predicted Rossmann fold flavoprotein